MLVHEARLVEGRLAFLSAYHWCRKIKWNMCHIAKIVALCNEWGSDPRCLAYIPSPIWRWSIFPFTPHVENPTALKVLRDCTVNIKWMGTWWWKSVVTLSTYSVNRPEPPIRGDRLFIKLYSHREVYTQYSVPDELQITLLRHICQRCGLLYCLCKRIDRWIQIFSRHGNNLRPMWNCGRPDRFSPNIQVFIMWWHCSASKSVMFVKK